MVEQKIARVCTPDGHGEQKAHGRVTRRACSLRSSVAEILACVCAGVRLPGEWGRSSLPDAHALQVHNSMDVTAAKTRACHQPLGLRTWMH